MADTYDVTCPHCQHLLTIDAAARAVTASKPPAKVKKSLAELMAEQDAAKDKRAAAFEAAAAAERTKKERLREQFKKSLAAAESAPPGDDFPRAIDL